MKLESQMTCEEVRADLPLFVGGDLFDDAHQASVAEGLRRHLRGCSSCTAEFVSLKRAREAFLTLGEDSTAPGLWPDVRAVLAAEGRFGGVVAAAPPVHRFRLAAAAALVVGLGVFVWLENDAANVSPGSGEPTGLAREGASVPEPPSMASPLRPVLPGELALSEEAAIFGVSEGVELVIPSHTSGSGSAASLTKIR